MLQDFADAKEGPVFRRIVHGLAGHADARHATDSATPR